MATVASLGTLGFPHSVSGETISGMLVEKACGLNLDGKSPSDDHVACMVRCAEDGDPIGILTETGFYTITGDWLVNNADMLAELMAKNVEATGNTSKVDGRFLIDALTIEVVK